MTHVNEIIGRVLHTMIDLAADLALRHEASAEPDSWYSSEGESSGLQVLEVFQTGPEILKTNKEPV